MKLREGFTLKNKDLAEWFGVKESSMKSGGVKLKKLEELKEYCDFELRSGKVYIKKVYSDTYKGNNRSKIFKYILEDLPNQIENGKPWTSKRLGEYYYKKLNKEYGGTDTTYETNVRLVRDRLWGKPDSNENIITKLCTINRETKEYELIEEEIAEANRRKEKEIIEKIMSEELNEDLVKEINGLKEEIEFGKTLRWGDFAKCTVVIDKNLRI